MLCLILTISANAQWPDNPDTNLAVTTQAGEQVIAKVAATSDGGCFVSFYNHAGGNYDMYMQRLDADGVIQWEQDGLLISDYPQDTWLTDYDMTVDMEDNAILTFNDIRAGGDWDIYAYRISPDGDFLWGYDGLAISDNTSFEADPKVIVTSAGNVVITWLEEDVVYVRKVDPDGNDLWDPAVKWITSEYGVTAPYLAPADDDSFILQVYVASGPNYWNPEFIYVHKYDSDGNELWDPEGVAVNTAGGIAPWMDAGIESDGAGGAYCYWYDTRNNIHHTFVQHVTSEGVAEWTENGVQLSLASNQLQMNPSMAYFGDTQEVVVFYLATNTNQSQFGLYGQKLDSNGERQWGDDGIAFVPLSGDAVMAINAIGQVDGAVVIYQQSPDALNDFVRAIKVDLDGDPVWDQSPVEMSRVLSEKLHMDVTQNNLGQMIAVWGDKRSDSGDIYLQNVNMDGTLGSFTTSVFDDNSPVPNRSALISSYPNPFNASAKISYELSVESDATIEIFDLLGRKVETLSIGMQPAGQHDIVWDASDFVTGVYFARFKAQNANQTIRMTLLK